MNTDDDALELCRLWSLIGRFRQAIWKASFKELAEHGITPEQAMVLYILEHVLPGASQAEIARRSIREDHTLSNVVSTLEAKGLIRRLPDPRRKNVLRLIVTDEGREALGYYVQRRAISETLGKLTKNERSQLEAIGTKLLDLAMVELGRYDLP